MRKTSLSNAVVVITGGARGIGLATAKAFYARGAKVAIGDVDGALAEQEAAKLGGMGMQIDVRDVQSVRAFVDAVVAEMGSIDVFVNNAGIMPTGAFHEESDAISDTQIDINLRGVIHGCKAVVPLMVAQGSGQVINVASMAGVLPIPGLAVYCATKFAVLGLTQSLREEYRDSGVGFSSIMPAKVTTELASGSDAAKGVPTSRPEDVAKAIVSAAIHNHADVTVPKYIGIVRPLFGATPLTVERLLRKAFGDRKVLQDLDAEARSGYNARINELAK